MTLIDYVDRVFEEGGILAQLGGRSVTEQHQYAISVAKSITHPSQEDRLSLLQADTGIGKSFGYLIPLMIHVATTPDFGDKKFIISTFTRQLQKQIFSEDVPFIRKVLSSLGLPAKQNVCIRIGKQGFFSLSRVQNVCNKIIASEPGRKNELKTFLLAVKEICEHGSGIWADYIEEYGDFPVGITANDICLLHHQKNENEAYLLHLDHAAVASIIITNHHSILTPDLTKLSNFDVEAVIVDEAHKIGGICQDMFNHRLGFGELTNLLNKISVKCKSSKNKIGNALACLSKLEVSLSKHPKLNSIEFISTINAPELYISQKENVQEFNGLFNAVLKEYKSSLDIDHLDLEDAELLNQFDSYSRAIFNWLNRDENQFQVSAFGISKNLKKISLATLNIRGSYLFSHIIKRISNNVVLTSATLSNAQRNLSFSQTQNKLGLRKFSVTEQQSLSPSKYADMQFILADKRIPSPILGVEEDEDDVVIFNPKWLINTVKMIEKARESGEPVLVLTVSHAESKLIASKIRNSHKVSLHQKNHSIKEYTADFIHGKTDVLITSAGWEGLNLRTAFNEQLIKNIVITRIPFAPPNKLVKYALEVISKTYPNVASYKNNIEWVDAIQEVVAKLKQGFGRGTRHPNDCVLIWIADSRMPHSRKDRNSVLLNAIPTRFLNNYLSAEIFEQKRKEIFYI